MKSILITGVNGGIGQALEVVFRRHGYYVIGTDIHNEGKGNFYIKADLETLFDNPDVLLKFHEACSAASKGTLCALINNAAVQIVGGVDSVSVKDVKQTMAVNVMAPLFLSQILLNEIESNKGMILNVGSIHSRLTKRRFVAYATSKAAIEGLTRSMAVDLGGRVRVNCLSPAAILTDMLVDGFKSNPEKLEKLYSFHPAGVIGKPDELAQVAFDIICNPSPFLSGLILNFDGAIGSALHDPS